MADIKTIEWCYEPKECELSLSEAQIHPKFNACRIIYDPLRSQLEAVSLNLSLLSDSVSPRPPSRSSQKYLKFVEVLLYKIYTSLQILQRGKFSTKVCAPVQNAIAREIAIQYNSQVLLYKTVKAKFSPEIESSTHRRLANQLLQEILVEDNHINIDAVDATQITIDKLEIELLKMIEARIEAAEKEHVPKPSKKYRSIIYCSFICSISITAIVLLALGIRGSLLG